MGKIKWLLLIIGIIGLLIFTGQYFENRGAVLKSRQIGEAADICYEQGGMLLIENRPGGLILTCQEIKVTIEVPAPPADCSKQDELIKELIRRDYIRSRSEL